LPVSTPLQLAAGSVIKYSSYICVVVLLKFERFYIKYIFFLSMHLVERTN
jgi:hypothetical protein